MIKTFDMELFLGAVQLDNAMYDRRKLSRLKLQSAGSYKRLGLGRESM